MLCTQETSERTVEDNEQYTHNNDTAMTVNAAKLSYIMNSAACRPLASINVSIDRPKYFIKR